MVQCVIVALTLLRCSTGVLRTRQDAVAGRRRAGVLREVQRVPAHRLRAVVSHQLFHNTHLGNIAAELLATPTDEHA